MQIQRIQNLYLLLAVIFAAISMFKPWLKIDGGYVMVENDVPLLVISLLATLLPLIGIFMFRNLRRQKLVCALSALMAVFSLGYCVSLSYLGPHPESEICIRPTIFMALSAIFDLLARRGAANDEKLLRSADRLR